MNFYYNFQNPYPMFNVCFVKCISCGTPIPVFPFQAYSICCQTCLLNHYNQSTVPNSSGSGPIQSLSISPPAAPIPTPTGKIIASVPHLTKRVLTPGEDPNIPQPLITSLLFICDFIFHFPSLLKIPSISLSQLYSTFCSKNLTTLFKTLCKTFCLKIVENAFRPDSEIKITEKSLILFMGFKLSEIFDIRTEIELIWPALVGELIKLKHFKDHIKGTVIEDVKKTLTTTLTIEIIELLTVDEKIALIEFMINGFVDSKEFREHIAEKVECQVVLVRSKSEKKQQIKSIENEIMMNPSQNTESEQEKKTLLLAEEERIKAEVEGIFFRTTNFGCDCEGNEYYFFEFEPWRIFVCGLSPNPNEAGNWSFYRNDEKLKKLCSEFQYIKKKEAKLRQALEKLVKTQLKTEEILEPSQTEQDFPEQERVRLDKIKENLKITEKTFSKYLNSSKKRWNFETDEKKWKNSVTEAENITALSELLLEFAEKASSPLRFQKVPKQKKIKYRKVILKLWQNSQEGYLAWENFVRACQNIDELMLGVRIYKKVVELYICKKQEDSIRHGDECYKCKDGGKLIMCENCPRVAHLKCVGLNKIPIGEWLCEHCDKSF